MITFNKSKPGNLRYRSTFKLRWRTVEVQYNRNL